MNDTLLDLPSGTRAKLIAALEGGHLELTASPTGLRAALGRLDDAGALASALRELHERGMSARGAAAALRAIERVMARQRKPDLVLSGLHVPGIYARDTRIVYNELLGSAERSVWLSSFVYYNGPKVFESIAQRVDDEALFITSANLTEAAGARNIKLGVLLRDRSMALSVISYFQRLIDTGHLRLLPG